MIKDTILINSNLLNGFWAKAIEMVNYFWNKLLTKTKSHGEVISKNSRTRQCQNLQYMRIFGSPALCNILDKKRSKSDYKKVWQEIIIEYSSDTTKYFCVWAP